jgi:hypothetical protein
MSPGIRWHAVIWILAAAIVMPATSALAAQGVSVDLGRVQVDDRLRPGERYRLPTIGVTNPGDEAGSYRVVIGARDGQRAAPDTWFRLEPASFDLAPGETQAVEVELVLPPDADPDRYEQLISAQLAVGDSGAAAVGAAAASILTFEVTPSSLLQGLGLSAVSFFQAGHPWSTLAIAALLAVVVARWVARNFEFAVKRRS